MKTLSEEINEIKNAKISKTAKRTALAKLGLLKSDVEIVMSSMPAPEARGSRFAYTFGVEIECYNVDRDLMHQSADANALRIAYEGYNHRDNTEYYKFVRDSSIVGDNGSRYHKVNAEAYKVHKTIEFRQHQGTTDFEKISHWVRFCAKLVGWSKRFALDSTVASIDEIPFLTKTEKNWFKRRAAVLSL